MKTLKDLNFLQLNDAYCNPDAIKEFLEDQIAEYTSDAPMMRIGKLTPVALR